MSNLLELRAACAEAENGAPADYAHQGGGICGRMGGVGFLFMGDSLPKGDDYIPPPLMGPG
jgi:hypothetical protein